MIFEDPTKIRVNIDLIKKECLNFKFTQNGEEVGNYDFYIAELLNFFRSEINYPINKGYKQKIIKLREIKEYLKQNKAELEDDIELQDAIDSIDNALIFYYEKLLPF